MQPTEKELLGLIQSFRIGEEPRSFSLLLIIINRTYYFTEIYKELPFLVSQWVLSQMTATI
jgi:hypothetical protein